MKKFYNYLIAVGLIFTACTTTENVDKDDQSPVVTTTDSHSYSNVGDLQTSHLHLDLEVNFSNKIIYGVAHHQMSKHSSDTAIFDIKGLEIKKITLGKDGETDANFSIGKSDPLFGAALTIQITPETEFINIHYQTTAESEALDWLKPELTSGKKQPFMYTQGQAILTRSWIPLQDTPLSRITYSADVKVPNNLLAVMSASNPTEKNNTGNYHFEMNQKIPAYLIALAVGNLEYTSLGGKCGLYSEPELTEACASEFDGIPDMMKAAENMYGEYRWDQYDIVILPYSFPFGGMENPRLTFANPTIIAGDKSSVQVIAHELAHSWSGNLVTNATWNDFWLNEGFTVYFENRIMEEVAGKEIADILAIIEKQELDVAIESMMESDFPEDTQLKLELEHRDPDNGMTDIAYVKGAYFLRTVEQEVGREKFDAFLKEYFNAHAFKTITTEDFTAYLEENLLKPNDVEFNTQEWIYEPGLPENCISISSERLDQMSVLADKVNRGEDIFTGEYKNMKRGDHITQEWQAFMRAISDSITPEEMNRIDAQLKFSTEGNPALKSGWFYLAVKVGNKDLRPEIEKYLIKIGRRWYIELIYQALKDSDDPSDLEFANEVFAKAKLNYHFVSTNTIEGILNE